MIFRILPVLVLLPWFSLSAAPVGVRFLAWNDEIATRSLSAGTTDAAKITGLHPLQRTNLYKVDVQDGAFSIQALDKKTAEGAPAPLVIKVADGMQRPLILLLPKPDAPSGLSALAIEDDESSLKWGTVRAFNATAGEVAMSIGATAKLLPTGWKAVDFQPDADKTVSLLIAAPDELRKPAATRQVLYSSVWTADSNVRALAFLVPGADARLGPVAVKVITEDRRALAAQKAAGERREGKSGGGQ